MSDNTISSNLWLISDCFFFHMQLLLSLDKFIAETDIGDKI